MYGRTDLADFYADRLTLRQLKVRLLGLPPEAPTWDLLREEHEKAHARRQAADIEDVLARFKT